MFRHFKFMMVVLTIALCFSAFAYGQETTGSIEGTVTDPNGAVVPGATVTVSSDAITRTVTTNDQGSYRVIQLRPGNYLVTVKAGNFEEFTRERVVVTLGISTPVNAKLKVAGVGGTVDVNPEDDNLIVDFTSSRVQTNLTEEELARLPKAGGMTSALKAVPSVRNEPSAAGFTVDGSTGVENSFIVDGQEVGNFRTGGLNTNNNLPFELIKEIQVKNSGFEAEFGGATGGVINVVTKGGGNQYHGSFGLAFQPQTLAANDRPVLRSNSNALQYIVPNRDNGLGFFPSASFSGPVVKDKLFFLVSAAPQYIRRERNYVFPDGSRGEFRREDQYDYYFARVDAAISDRLNVFSTFTYNPLKINGLLPSYSTLVAAGRVASSGATDPAFQGQQGGRQPASNFNVGGNAIITDDFIVTARWSRGYLNEKLSDYGIPNATRFQCVTSGLPFGFNCDAGFNNFINQKDVFDISIRKNFEVDASLLVDDFGGRHRLKFGFQRFDIFNEVETGYITPGRVLFYFGFTTAASNGTIFGNRPGEAGFARLVQIGEFGEASSKNESIYIQDSWQPISNLTLNLGVRFEREGVPSFTPGFEGINFGFADKIAPRLGFAWDVGGNGKVKIFANYGEFFDRFKYELPRGSFGGNRFDDYRAPLLTSMPNIFSYTLNYVQANSLVFTNFRVPSNDPADFRVEPDLKPVRQKEYTVGTQIDFGNQTVLSARYTRKTLNETIEDIGYHDANNNESYIIANPGRGICAQSACGRYPVGAPAAVPRRQYDALEATIDKRFSPNFIVNATYTWSRLYGNYSGLASTDEYSINGGARDSPNVNRFFDTPFDGFNVGGAPNNGPLPTDRPHAFKFFGTYVFNNADSFIKLPQNNELEFSGFTTITSGTPVTTRVDLIDNAYIPLFGRGDLGRTPVFSETDLSATYRYRFGPENKLSMQFTVEVLNAFNESNVLGIFESISSHNFQPGDFAAVGATIAALRQDFDRAFFDGRITGTRISTLINTAGNAINSDKRYNNPQFFQNERTVRLGFSFRF